MADRRGMLPLNETLPMEGRATFLPFQDTLPGSVMNERSWALPGMLAGAWNAFTAPRRAWTGALDPTGPEAIEEAMNVAGYPMLTAPGLAGMLPVAGATVAGMNRITGPTAGSTLAALRAEITELAKKTGLTREEGARFQQLTNDYHAAQYDRGLSPGTPADIAPADVRMSTLAPEANNVARGDLIRDKDVYLAISEAAAGTFDNAMTAVDRIMLGQHPSVTPQQLYDTFAASRAALRAQYGDTVPLYRAEGKQRQKPTTNWATTEEFARQFGNRIVRRDVPVEDILAINVSKNGKYHELLIGKPPGADKTIRE